MSVTVSHILKNENYELCFLAGSFINQITTGKNYDWKKRYSHLADDWNKSQITTVCCVKIRTPITTGKNYDRKKIYSHLAGYIFWRVPLLIKSKAPPPLSNNLMPLILPPQASKPTTASTTPTACNLRMALGSSGTMIWWRHCTNHGERGGKAAGG
jgi:hypothetical protein